MTSPLDAGYVIGRLACSCIDFRLLSRGGRRMAFIGGFCWGARAFGLILLIAGPRGMTGVALIIAGMVVNLLFGAIATAVVLLRAQFVENVFLWGPATSRKTAGAASLRFCRRRFRW